VGWVDYTTPHRVDGRAKQRRWEVLRSTGFPHADAVSQRNIGACALAARSYIARRRRRGRVGTGGLDNARRLTGSGGNSGEGAEERGLRRPSIRVTNATRSRRGQSRASSTSRWRGGVQRGRSVRDSIDPQRPSWRTQWLWPAAGGWKPELPAAEPLTHQSAVVAGRRTVGANPLTPGNQHARRSVVPSGQAGRLFWRMACGGTARARSAEPTTAGARAPSLAFRDQRGERIERLSLG
jgi:hypothetical protein